MELLDGYIRFYNERRKKQSLGWIEPHAVQDKQGMDWSRFLGQKNKLLQSTSRSRSHGAL